jgi:hypothetical protein
MRNLIRLTVAIGALFVTLSVGPAQAADGRGVLPQVGAVLAANPRAQADHYADGGQSIDIIPPGGDSRGDDLRIVTVVVTHVSAADRVVTVELFPREIALRPGDGVLWVNVVPGAILRVVFEGTPPVAGTCTTPTPITARSSFSTLVAQGTAGLYCFLAPGTFPYHAVIMTPDAEVALPGVVVVEE